MKNEQTLREKILNFFLENPGVEFSINDIARFFGLNPRESKRLYEDIIHVSKTLWRQFNGTMYIAMKPPVCRFCGYVFKDIKKPKKPSRCPRCKSERIDPPKFVLVVKR